MGNVQLLEFAQECIGLIKSVIYIEEILYQLEMRFCMFNADTIEVGLKNLIKKQGRNEKYLCESGKKSKKYCGR